MRVKAPELIVQPTKTLEELIQEAKDDVSPSLRPFSAFYRPGVIWRRYRRHTLADGNNLVPWLDVLWTFRLQLIAGLVATGGVLVLYMANGFPILSTWPTSLAIGAIVSWWFLSGKMFHIVHGILFVSHNPDPLRPWQSSQFLRVWQPRLAFHDRQDDVFYGSYADGYMRVETPDIDLTIVRERRHFYDMAPGTRQLQEGPLVDGYTRMRTVERNGLDLHNTRSKSLAEHLAANWGFIVGVIFIVIAAYCVLQMQEGELLGRPDVAAYHKQVEAELAAEQRAAAEAEVLP